MALNIKDAETDRLARELAERTGESITVATRTAIRDRLIRVRAGARTLNSYQDLIEIIERGRERALLDDRSADEILGYDQDGLPG